MSNKSSIGFEPIGREFESLRARHTPAENQPLTEERELAWAELTHCSGEFFDFSDTTQTQQTAQGQAVGWLSDESCLVQDAADGLSELQDIIHAACVRAGWWTDLSTGERKDRNVGELLCLVHSEISEAMEGHRKNLMDDHLPHRKMIEVELADAIIRICDIAGGLGLDLGGAVAEKHLYNQQRADHKIEARKQAGGKAY